MHFATSLHNTHTLHISIIHPTNRKSLFTTEEEYIEGLMRIQDHQVRAKHNSGCLVLVVVHLHSCVAGATIGHHLCFIPILKKVENDVILH